MSIAGELLSERSRTSMRRSRFSRWSNHLNRKAAPSLRLPLRRSQLFQCHRRRMRLAPMAHRVQQRPQRLSQRSDRINNSWRRIRINGTVDDSRALQCPKLLRQCPLRDSADCAFQLGKPLGALEQLLQDRAFPPSSDDSCRGLHRAEFWEFGHNHLGSRLYTTYPSGVTYSHVTTLAPASSI
jgi:hypothetical protein